MIHQTRRILYYLDHNKKCPGVLFAEGQNENGCPSRIAKAVSSSIYKISRPVSDSPLFRKHHPRSSVGSYGLEEPVGAGAPVPPAF